MLTKKENVASISLFFALSFLLIFTINFTASDLFSKWDENNNNKLSKSEFMNEFSTEFYSAWDIRSDEDLDADDFHMVVFNVADANRDEYLDRAEIEWGHKYMYGDYVEFNYIINETDENGGLEFNRFHDMLKTTNYFSDIDLDNNEKISEEELTEAVFSDWDMNGNGYLSEEEFSTFDQYYFQIDQLEG